MPAHSSVAQSNCFWAHLSDGMIDAHELAAKSGQHDYELGKAFGILPHEIEPAHSQLSHGICCDLEHSAAGKLVQLQLRALGGTQQHATHLL